jgi:hypothetical protein
MAITRKIECLHTVAGTVLAHVLIPGSKRKYQKFQCVSLCCTVMVQSPGRNKVEKKSFTLTDSLYTFLT